VVLDGVQPLAEQRPGPGFGAVAVDVGWRWLGDRLRVAYWVGLDGRCGELAIGEHDLDRWLYADVLQSEQDRRFDAMRAHIIAWRERVGPAMPDWLAEAFATLPKWRSTGRLAALCRRWGQERVDGDAELMPVLDEWMKRDCRLHTERSCLLKKAARWREDLYRQFAADLQNRYQTLLVEDADWRDLLRAPDVTDEDETNRRRRYARIASPGMMRQILRACGRAVKLASEYTTQRCGACGEIEAFDAAENLVHTCRHCGARWDQDENACRIMLGLHSGELAPASGPVA
jgi:hypothetical protein